MKLKIKNKEGLFLEIKNIKSLRMTSYSKLSINRNIQSLGWRDVLDQSGGRYVAFKINGVAEEEDVNDLLSLYAIENCITEYEMEFDSGRKVFSKCSIESYEIICDPIKFDDFNLVLFSAGKVVYV